MIHTAHLSIDLTKEHIVYKGNAHGHKSFNQIVRDNKLVGIQARRKNRLFLQCF